jgi:hypothetical protein
VVWIHRCHATSNEDQVANDINHSPVADMLLQFIVRIIIAGLIFMHYLMQPAIRSFQEGRRRMKFHELEWRVMA